MSWVLGLLGLGLLLGLLYWLIIFGEGSYLGPWAVRLIYNLGAGVYDQIHGPVTVSDERHLLAPLRAALEPTGAGRVLDVATGTGRVPLLLARQPWFDGEVEALDLSPAMLREAERKLAGLTGAARVRLHCGSAGRLRWPDAEFDLVTCLEALEYFPRPRRALCEMVRVLRPEGTLIVSAWTARSARWLPGKALDGRRMSAFLRALGCQQVEVRRWQPGYYDLVIASKPPALAR